MREGEIIIPQLCPPGNGGTGERCAQVINSGGLLCLPHMTRGVGKSFVSSGARRKGEEGQGEGEGELWVTEIGQV